MTLWYYLSMYSVLNKFSKYVLLHIESHYFIHFCWLFLKSSKAFSVSVRTTALAIYHAISYFFLILGFFSLFWLLLSWLFFGTATARKEMSHFKPVFHFYTFWKHLQKDIFLKDFFFRKTSFWKTLLHWHYWI